MSQHRKGVSVLLTQYLALIFFKVYFKKKNCFFLSFLDSEAFVNGGAHGVDLTSSPWYCYVKNQQETTDPGSQVVPTVEQAPNPMGGKLLNHCSLPQSGHSS